MVGVKTYVELQRYSERRDGWEWVTVAGPEEKKSYVISAKIFNNQWTPCTVSGEYRETGWATWTNSKGETGRTDHESKTAHIEC